MAQSLKSIKLASDSSVNGAKRGVIDTAGVAAATVLGGGYVGGIVVPAIDTDEYVDEG